MAKIDPSIVFHCQLSRVTNDDGEQVTISFNAPDAGVLRTRLAQASEALNRQRKVANEKIVEATAEMRKTVEDARAKIVREDRKRLADLGMLPRDLIDFDFREMKPREEPDGADAATGAPDLRADS